MTVDEKLAEEYANETFGLYYPTEQERYQVEQAFLAGLKAGRSKWHDLQKDPNDLPTCDCETISLHKNGNKNIQKWKNGNWTNAIVIPVIAWYELPKFEV